MRILNQLAMEKNIAPCFLEFIGMTDESNTVGKIFYHFNVMDEQHPRYKSTLAKAVDAD